MPKNKVKKDEKTKVWTREISSGTLEENNAYTLTIEIPGRGKLKVGISFEKESKK